MLLFNRKAYTMSQFVLLWILGALFVLLVCLNVLRYHATIQVREAEAFMQQVRAEQEDRCALGRKYAVYSKHLKTFYKRKKSSRAVRYDLSSGQGITAHHKLFDYRLQMPSYADGRVCCDNCEKLNYYYSRCDVLTKRKDFVPSDPECTVYAPGKKGKTPPQKAKPADVTDDKTPQDPVSAATEKSMAEEKPASDTPSDGETPQPADPSAPASAGEQTADTALPAASDEEKPAQQPAVKSKAAPRVCKTPAQGDFFIDECEIYQPGTRGSVLHTWSSDKCAYEVSQSCVMPASWKRSSSTKEEKGLYPSDLEDYCPQLLKNAPCPAGAGNGRECATVDAVCYKDCQITRQTEVKESSLVILYDVEIKVEQLKCMPAKEVTVPVK